jgi:hypothetical protein
MLFHAKFITFCGATTALFPQVLAMKFQRENTLTRETVWISSQEVRAIVCAESVH